MENVFYKPWVGENYERTGFRGKRILVLGESHYCGENCPSCGLITEKKCNNFTTNVLNAYLNYKNGLEEHEGWMNTFTKFTNVIYGDNIDKDTLLEFWNSVMFYNYVQIAIAGPRISPKEIDFQKSESAFFEVLNKYSPDLIIVWGDRLWENLPGNGRWGNMVHSSSKDRYYFYKTNGKEIPAFCIYHPSSSAFNYNHTGLLNEAISKKS